MLSLKTCFDADILPETVLMAVTPSAPPSLAAVAILKILIFRLD